MRVRYDFRLLEICPEYTIEQWLSDNSVDIELRRTLAVFLKQPYIQNRNDDLEDAFLGAEINYRGQSAGEGMTVAAVTVPKPAPLVSFYSRADWGDEYLAVEKYTRSIEQNVRTRLNVPHLSRQWHVRANLIYFSEVEFREKPWKPTYKIPLPKHERCALLVLGNWSAFLDLLKKRRSEKLAIIKTMAAKVALINCYQENNELSTKNSIRSGRLRDIYTFQIQDYWMHLSVDFEKGGFEVYQANGRHLGEIGFHGNWNSTADEFGHHDIEI